MEDFSGLFQPILMTLFTWSLLAISAALLMIQVQLVEYHEPLTLKNEQFARIMSIFTLHHRSTDAPWKYYDSFVAGYQWDDWICFSIHRL